MTARIQIRGLTELQAAFRAVDKDIPKELRIEFKHVAEMVVGRVRGMVPRSSGDAANSIKPRATQKGAGLAYPGGGADSRNDDHGKAPYYPFLDWGGTTGRGHRSSVVKNRRRGSAAGSGVISRPWVGSDGRYIYPTIARSGEEIRESAEDAVTKVARSHKFEVRGS